MNALDVAVGQPPGRPVSGRHLAVGAGAAALVLVPLIWIDPTTYLVLTVAGLAMGMLLFLTAVGLTLIFGLMDVLNLAHGAFFAWGGYVGFSVLQRLDALGWVETGSLGQSVGSTLLALAAAAGVGAVLGVVVERVVVRRVYGDHLKQILITVGLSLVMAEVIKIVWGPNDEMVLVPQALQGSYDLFDVVVNRFRVLAVVVGVAVFGGLHLLLRRTRLGLVVRAGVENREIVEVMGYDIGRIFTAVFAGGAALAAVGGAMWAVFREQIHPGMGDENLILALIVVIIGGMGSVTGSFVGAVVVGLAFNYVSFLVPKLALGVNILIMVIVLLLRPQGLMGQE
ncbi:MAG: branched-chain amino acid ABC transporter permease [Deltaproteobacteria bacterium]|nr:branched-chain amino acid ABC transporter permease [Deltaproteobacteria bacterium]